jgi:hypothetical protein
MNKVIMKIDWVRLSVILGLLWAGISMGAAPAEQNDYGWEFPKQYLEWLNKVEGEAYAVGMEHPQYAVSPVGRWALLRKGTSVCALRFVQFHHERSKDNLPPSRFRDSFFAEYDWYYQGDGSGDFNKPNVESGHGQASRKPNLWRFERGTKYVNCGPLKAEWNYPNSISLVIRDHTRAYVPESDKSNDIEIALTGWKDITKVNAHDPRLPRNIV